MKTPAENIAEHLVKDHPQRFGRDLPRIARDVQDVIDKARLQHTVQHGTLPGSRMYHYNGKSVVVRPDGSGTMVSDANGNTFRNWLSLEP